MNRVLFILKKRHNYGEGYSHSHHSSGLFNSARMCSEMLEVSGIPSEIVEVIDNNDIDREVSLRRPTHVIIEALWVVPSKFDILRNLHPKVTWIVRIHSEISFLATEGIAIEWILGYSVIPNVVFAVNSFLAYDALEPLLGSQRLWLLPNFYPVPASLSFPSWDSSRDTFDIGAFGAIRPMKNQLAEAFAAQTFAYDNRKALRFHINYSRVEQGGESVVKNLRALLGDSLIEHPWMEHTEFLDLMATMDISMCVSLSESFCIVAADSVISGVPLVCSAEVPWSASQSQASARSIPDIVDTMNRVTGFRRGFIMRTNARKLKSYCSQSQSLWLQRFES